MKYFSIFRISKKDGTMIPFPKFVENVHHRMVTHRNWLIGGWEGVPVYGLPDKKDYAHMGSEAILKYIEEKQPKYVYHGHVHTGMGAMINDTAVVSVFGAKVFNLS